MNKEEVVDNEEIIEEVDEDGMDMVAAATAWWPWPWHGGRSVAVVVADVAAAWWSWPQRGCCGHGVVVTVSAVWLLQLQHGG